MTESQPEDNPQARLDRALCEVADALAELPPGAFAKLCKREAAETVTTMQFFEARGVGDSLLPQITIGAAIVRALVERHPGILGEPPADAA